MELTSITIGVPVSDMAKAKTWYIILLGATKTIQPVPNVFEFEISKGFWLQLIEDPALKAGDGTLRFGVKDIEAEKSRLAIAGISVGKIQEVPGVIRLCRFTDPFGNKLSLYQEI